MPEPKAFPVKFACPVTFTPLPALPEGAQVADSVLTSVAAGRQYKGNGDFIDLTITTGQDEFLEIPPASVQTFRSPFVSFAYERGWRNSFARAGFPGYALASVIK